ncbi:hypothetical protein AM587_10003263 [Phytophthora nicotianae]|uniref:Uncharacterized protein n=1 Tax=Phytophthora nicotianae TaxID=4792 RepID=A0A0W8CNW5_PHYNI|nr:hypothetical protein AM587_10003263 [Phytophthora nicotianae]
MEDGKDTTTSLLLCMGEALAKYEREVDDARDEVFLLMIKEVMQPSSAVLQNAMYNGWLHVVFATETICYAADSCIIGSRHNYPGSWNDADTSLGIRNKLLDPIA